MTKPPELVPEDGARVKIRAPSHVAGGAPAVVQTMKHAVEEMGLVRGAKTLLRVNQHGGFDCPGCAWPEPDGERSIAEFCENGAKAVASEATTKAASPDFFREHSVADLARQQDVWLNAQGRLTHPMVLREGAANYVPISWDDAFALVADHLSRLASPDEAVFYTSGRTSNEAAFLYQLFVRQLGTNNLPDCSNMCHESSGCALKESIGVGKGTVTLEDFDHADAVFVVGQNPGTNHPRMLTTLEAAAKRGCAIVSINPLAEVGTLRFKHPQDVAGALGSGTRLATLHLPVRIHGDLALFKGIMKEMLEAEDLRPGTVLDRAFVREKTSGFEAFEAALRDVSWEEILEASGVAREGIREAARIAMHAKRTIACWAMGLTQHKHAVATIQEVVHFLLLRGNMGRPGAGACPVRGHSNVQGDRTMGIWEKMPDEFLDRLGASFAFTPPRRHGYDTVDSIRAMQGGKVKVFFGMGGNFLSAAPDTEATARALSQCALTVQVSTKLHRAHLVTGKEALILPCLGRTEIDAQATGPQVVTTENSMGVVQASHGTLKPASPMLKSEVAIVCALAVRVLGGKTKVPWEDFAASYDSIRDAIAEVIPGFEDYNARARSSGGFHLPNAARDGVFRTETGKARFFVHPIPKQELAKGELLMMTIRSHDQYNTTVYGTDDRYRGVMGGRRAILMNEGDMGERGLSAGDFVDVTSRWEGRERRAPHFRVVPYDIPRGCAATYFPEGNVLVPLEQTANRSGTPASKSVVITVKRSDPEG